MRDARRRFSRRQKRTMALRARFKCELCAADVSISKAHADHIIPYSRDGATTLGNGQYLCVTCNLKKGARMPGALLKWQAEALEEFENSLEEGRDVFLAVACTGSGKTRFGVEAARRAYHRAWAEDIIVVVCPTKAISMGWGRALQGTRLETVTSFDYVDDACDALVMTYSAMAAHGGLVREWLKREQREPIVVLDEIHHVAESAPGSESGWGEAVTAALGGIARNIIALTATPYRSKGRIALLDHYYTEAEGGSVIANPDFSHRYIDELNAIDDPKAGIYRNVTPCAFTLRHASAEVRRRCSETRRVLQSFDVHTRDAHSLDEHGRACGHSQCKESSMLSRYVPRGAPGEMEGAAVDVIRSMLYEAGEALKRMRSEEGMWWAGGLVICSNKDAARNVRRWIDDNIGKASLVTSDDSEAQALIDDFKRGGSKNGSAWLVSVDMVSEGVDISRLKVLVSIGTKQTQLRIIQEIGRVIRRHRDKQGIPYPGPQTAHVYALNVPAWRYVAMRFEEDMKQAAAAELDRIGEELEREAPSSTLEVAATHSEGSTVIIHGEAYEDERVGELAQKLIAMDFDGLRAARHGYQTALKLAAHMVRTNTAPPEVEHGAAEGGTQELEVQTRQEQMTALRKQGEAMLKRLTRAHMDAWPKMYPDFRRTKLSLTMAVNKQAGCKSAKEATKEELEKRIEEVKKALSDSYLIEALREARNG